MGLEFRYILGKALGTQDHPTLASHRCVLCLNLIKNKINTCILTHTHTSMHLTYNMASFIPWHISIHKAIKSQTRMRNPSMWNLIIHLKTRQQLKHGSKASHIMNKIKKASTSYTYTKRGLNKQHACTCEWMTYLTYLAASPHLLHCAWACEWMIMVFKRDINMKP